MSANSKTGGACPVRPRTRSAYASYTVAHCVVADGAARRDGGAVRTEHEHAAFGVLVVSYPGAIHLHSTDIDRVWRSCAPSGLERTIAGASDQRDARAARPAGRSCSYDFIDEWKLAQGGMGCRVPAASRALPDTQGAQDHHRAGCQRRARDASARRICTSGAERDRATCRTAAKRDATDGACCGAEPPSAVPTSPTTKSKNQRLDIHRDSGDRFSRTRRLETNSMRLGVRRLIIVLGLWSSFAALATSTAHAGPLSKPALPEARNHLALGNRLYGVRSFVEAISEYKAGSLIEPAPVFDYNLGQSYRQLGKYEEAIWHYERFLARGNPQGEVLDAVKGFIAQMKSELDKKAMAQKPEPAPSASPVSSQESPPPVSPRQTTPYNERPAARTKEPWYHDGFGWAFAGAGALGVAVGTGFLINAASLNDEANKSANQADYSRLHDKASTRNLAGAITGAGGAGLLIIGIIKLAIHSKEPSQITAWNLAPAGNGVMVFGRF